MYLILKFDLGTSLRSPSDLAAGISVTKLAKNSKKTAKNFLNPEKLRTFAPQTATEATPADSREPPLPLSRVPQGSPLESLMPQVLLIPLSPSVFSEPLMLPAQTGKMPERSIGTVSKTVVPLRVPRVRIPVFPQPNRTKISPKATNRRLSNSSAVFSCLILSIQDRNQTKKRPQQT